MKGHEDVTGLYRPQSSLRGASPPRDLQELFTSMHRMHRIFSGNGQLVILTIRKSVRDHRRSRLLLQQLPVLVILCILYIHVFFKFFIYMDEQDTQDFFSIARMDRSDSGVFGGLDESAETGQAGQ